MNANTNTAHASSILPSSQTSIKCLDVLILGAGVSGLSAAIKIKEQGITNIRILERADRVGGTWALNDYPGLRCDVPSELYSLGYAPKSDWSRSYSPQAEIRNYIEDVAKKFNVLEDVDFNTEVAEAIWDDVKKLWSIITTDGLEHLAKLFICAPGFIGEGKMPEFAGMSDFQGTMFHSGAWNHDHDLTGKRVAVIGSGASAIQFLPAIQPKVGKLISFQRSPSWVLPKPDFQMPKVVSTLFKRMPFVQKAIREGGLLGLEGAYPLLTQPELATAIMKPLNQFMINISIKDPVMRRKLTPDHLFACKRPMMSNNWYSALAKPNVEVVFQGAERITKKGVVASDGTEYQVDTIIFGTGYTAGDLAISRIIKGRNGQTLAENWNGSPRAYMGLAIHNFPNMFLMLGPNSQTHQLSCMAISELESVYIALAAKQVFSRKMASFEVKKSVQDSFNANIDKRLEKLPMQPHICKSYYNDRAGRNHIVWPEWGFNVKKQLSHFNVTDYDIE